MFQSFAGPELIIISLFVLPAIVTVVVVVAFWLRLPKMARRFGYPSTFAYLRAAPRSDAEKRDAADMTLKGLVWCLLGMIFSPLVLVGLVPLFYGGRKLAYAWMGLGLVDDGGTANA
jgi:hypothetical protein